MQDNSSFPDLIFVYCLIPITLLIDSQKHELLLKPLICSLRVLEIYVLGLPEEL